MKTAITKSQATVARKSGPFFNKQGGGKFFGPDKGIQRKCEHCEKEKEQEAGGILQRQAAGVGAAGAGVAGSSGPAAPVARRPAR